MHMPKKAGTKILNNLVFNTNLPFIFKKLTDYI